MSALDNDIVHIDLDLKLRLTALALRSGRTLDELAEAVLRDHADAEERSAADLAEDGQRWQRYLETGESVAADTVRSRLQKLAADAAGHRDGA